MQLWAFVAPLSSRHVYAQDRAKRRYYSNLENSLQHHLSVSGMIWSMGDELGLAGTTEDMLQIWSMAWLEPASTQGEKAGAVPLFFLLMLHHLCILTWPSRRPRTNNSAVELSIRRLPQGLAETCAVDTMACQDSTFTEEEKTFQGWTKSCSVQTRGTLRSFSFIGNAESSPRIACLNKLLPHQDPWVLRCTVSAVLFTCSYGNYTTCSVMMLSFKLIGDGDSYHLFGFAPVATIPHRRRSN